MLLIVPGCVIGVGINTVGKVGGVVRVVVCGEVVVLVLSWVFVSAMPNWDNGTNGCELL